MTVGFGRRWRPSSPGEEAVGCRVELPTGIRPLLDTRPNPRPDSSFDPTRTGFAERSPACLDVSP
ncbi:hypothetical protein ACFYXP_29925 [Streptomyces sp. NPDC002466]|uniref:hypothetical protein n=1 Tax=unclassified Streptomyces TaxID=2593676 RepID=UPI00331A6EEC